MFRISFHLKCAVAVRPPFRAFSTLCVFNWVCVVYCKWIVSWPTEHMDHLYFWQCLLNGHSISSYSWYQVAERETPYKDKTLFIYIFAIRWILDSQRQQRAARKRKRAKFVVESYLYYLFALQNTKKSWRRANDRASERVIYEWVFLLLSVEICAKSFCVSIVSVFEWWRIVLYFHQIFKHT